MKQLNTMRRLLTGVLAMVFVLGSAGHIDAQIAAWDFTGAAIVATWDAGVFNANLASSATITRGPGAVASAGSNSFRTQGFQNDGISVANTDYFQITLNPSPGFTMSLSSIDATVNGTGTFAVTPGVSQQYAYSTNGTDFTLIGSPSIIIGTNQFFSVDVSGVTALQEVPEGTTIYIRYYASGQTATGGWGFFSSNGLSVNGTVDVVAGAVVPPSSVTATAVSSNQINLSWNQNDSTDDILLAFNTTDTFGEPSGTYTIGNSISGGGTVLAVGASTSFNHTSLDPNTQYFYSIWSKDGSDTYSPQVTANATTAKNEPSNHVTNAQMLSGRESIIIKWDDVTTGVLPDGYLVKVSDAGFASISNPTDGTDPSNDLDLSDGSASVKVAHGTRFISFVGLTQGQAYYAKVFPYTNEGTLIDFKTDGTVPQVQTTVQSYISVFKEPFSTSSTTGFNSYTSSDNAGFTFAGDGDVRTTTPSTGYTNASGGGNAFFTTSPRELVISGINTTGLEDLSLQFGMNSASGVGLTVEVSDDGVNYTVLPYNPRPATGWNLETIAGAQLPEGENIRLKFTNNSNSIRLDDLELYQVGYSAQLTGSAGYRLLSSPVEVSLQNFLAPVWTQGATAGADTDAGNPNVFTWNNSATNDDAANWSGVTDLTANLSAGNGVLVYVFQDDVYETPGSFPKTLSVSGTVNTLPVTPTMNSNSGGLTLVGNPIASIISWTALSRTDLSNTVYAWDPNTTLGDGGTDANNPSAGSWKTYNTSIGDLTDGRIHPFQAFFVQTSGNSPVLSIAQGAESTGGSFYGKETAPYAVRLQLDGEAISASKWLSFTGDAEVGRDNSDALQFQPLSLEYSLLASKLTDGTLLDINNLPVDLQETVRFPLIVESTQSGTHTLRVTELNLPTGYEVSILDNVTSLEHPLTLDFELSFELGTVAKNVPTPQNVIASGNLVAKAVEGDDRFELIVSPGTTLSNGILSELPAELALGQNYPNPFNPTTRIAFELPSSQFVKLSVFNMLGQEVSTLLQSEMNAGSHFVNFDASQLSSGVYVYRLEAVGQVITRKMTLVK